MLVTAVTRDHSQRVKSSVPTRSARLRQPKKERATVHTEQIDNINYVSVCIRRGEVDGGIVIDLDQSSSE